MKDMMPAARAPANREGLRRPPPRRVRRLRRPQTRREPRRRVAQLRVHAGGHHLAPHTTRAHGWSL